MSCIEYEELGALAVVVSGLEEEAPLMEGTWEEEDMLVKRRRGVPLRLNRYGSPSDGRS